MSSSPFLAERASSRCRPLLGVLCLSLLAAAGVAVLGCGSGGDDTAGPTDYGGADASTPSNDGGLDGSTDSGDGGGCVPKTCAQLEASCGSAPDGCGGKVECGTCPDGQQCGGGGTNKCGTDACNPKTCVSLGASCGYASDGCSLAIDCGTCPSPFSCGGGGKENQCGCAPKTCAQLGASCGSVPDGCDGMVECGDCPAGQTCGGGGSANTCGAGTCTSKTCAQVGASCGFVSDGCSKALDCGSCSGENVCGGGGKPNQCGCSPKTCVQLGVSCGSAPNGCGGTLDCGSCPAGETCGGGGTEGQCGCTCSAPNATTSCSGGVCAIAKCQAGWGDCDGDVVNGCETDVRSNVDHCGTCATTCAFAHATSMCTNGQCVVGACENGFANCDGAPDNGCEIDTNNDPDHCGSCTNVCDAVNGTPACSGGACGVDCTTGWGDCNSSVADGCEVDLTNDVHHCGSCSNDCVGPTPDHVADAACSSGSCTIVSCTSNAYDQNGTYADGCECLDDGVTADCGAAFQIPPGTVAVGGSTTQAGTLTPTGDQDWYVINFAGTDSCSYHPRIELEDQSGTGSIRIDATTDCGGTAIACSEGGGSTGTLVWEFTFSDACGASLAIDPAKQASSPATVYIHVYASGPSTTCLPYVLHISN